MKLFISTVTATQLIKAYAELPEKDQVLVASFIAADLMTKDAEFARKLSRRHKQMDAGEKQSQAGCWNITTK